MLQSHVFCDLHSALLGYWQSNFSVKPEYQVHDEVNHAMDPFHPLQR